MNNMGNMNAMGGIGGPGVPPGPQQPPQQGTDNRHAVYLNTYIYDYLLRNEMYDAARGVLKSGQPINVEQDRENGLGGDSMDTDSKDDVNSKKPEDLPAPILGSATPDISFLYEWFSMFWDLLNASKGKYAPAQVSQYITHTQNHTRMRQQTQQEMLRGMRPDMAAQQQQFLMMNRPNGNMNMMNKNQSLHRGAIANTQNQMQMLAQQKQGQMQRDPSDMDGNRQRPSSPSSADNAPSPSKRVRLDGGPGFNPGQPGMMPNGRPGAPGMPNQQTYAQNLQQHHGNQMPNKPMPGPNAPQGQGSPMVASGPDGTQLNAFYNAQEPMGAAPNGGMRPGVPATQNGSNHALQDYQMQLMLLEQQNKKRLMMARQEQDGIQGQGMARADGPGGPGPAGGPGGPAGAPNGPQFQGASPQGARPGASPNPSEQMKRAAGQMNNGSMGSPLPEGAQNRESPNNPMNFMAAQMNGGMNRPPSSHPGQQPFSQMNPQQQAMMRQQQMQQQQQGGPNGQPMPGQWQGGPNGQMPGGPQGGPQQGPVHGTPQQRAMPPPSAPTAAANSNANQRNTTASPQVSNAAPPTPSQANKAAPKKKDTKAKDKKKSNANLNAAGGATPAADGGNDGEAPTPATPMTPMAASQQNFNKPGPAAGGAPPQQMPNGQPPAAAPTAAPVAPQQHNDPNQFNMEGGGMDFNLDFANPLASGDVLNDFDFDSFLHDNVEDTGFGFDGPGLNFEGTNEIGAD
ncbi:hypothetical protein, variant [Pyricularia oryzae 70-15]|uniref:LisH domain-containing protein n=1 Tax=Pyricularia oryzae (strain 70-15 / ATCC MYA-4617 / FGSC 8958) TaxID=242507 RepID=G4MR97_PYRO7|nr:hypothetical protein, variant [Pyricularia oryzae 70-15]EHA58222.1 hypothetical protein, variant [Pyricularia oryzae 70-15]